VVGTNDLAKEMRCRLDVGREALVGLLAMIVATGRAYDLAVLDGVFNELDDEAGLRRQCHQGADLGFDGKTLIHPTQIPIANEAFSPDAEEVAWSQKILDAFDLPENREKGVLRLDGRMVERLHLDQAHRVLQLASA
jgi:citrate lyase subunit beta/citryl-CoA lyase